MKHIMPCVYVSPARVEGNGEEMSETSQPTRSPIWPDNGWKIIGPLLWTEFPIGCPSSGNADDMLQHRRLLLEPIWYTRLDCVPTTVLSLQAKGLIRDRVKSLLSDAGTDVSATTLIRRSSGVTAGFEKVCAAVAGDATACWFLDRGALAWLVTLTTLRANGLLPSDPASSLLDDVERAWHVRDGGERIACDLLDAKLTAAPLAHPALALYRVPLALWFDRDPGRAIRWLDRAVSRMTDVELYACGPTIRLTYALAHALSGRYADATAALMNGDDGPWLGLSRPADMCEVAYHRARYLWDARHDADAIALLRPIVVEDPTYVIRLVTDPVWRSAASHSLDLLDAMLADVVEKARVAFTLVGDESNCGDPYLILSDAARLATSHPDEVTVNRAFSGAPSVSLREGYARVSTFASSLPRDFELQVGDGFGAQFRGSTKSDIALLDRLMAERDWEDALQFVCVLEDMLPHAVKQAALNCLVRLTTAMVTREEQLTTVSSPSDTDEHNRNNAPSTDHTKSIHEMATQCVAIGDAIKALPEEVGGSLAIQLATIWERMNVVKERWIAGAFPSLYRYRLQLPSAPVSLSRTEPTVLTVEVRDDTGHPVAGLPVAWRVVSGAAAPQSCTPCVAEEWALTEENGVAYLSLRVDTKMLKADSDRGVLETYLVGYPSKGSSDSSTERCVEHILYHVV